MRQERYWLEGREKVLELCAGVAYRKLLEPKESWEGQPQVSHFLESRAHAPTTVERQQLLLQDVQAGDTPCRQLTWPAGKAHTGMPDSVFVGLGAMKVFCGFAWRHTPVAGEYLGLGSVAGENWMREQLGAIQCDLQSVLEGCDVASLSMFMSQKYLSLD